MGLKKEEKIFLEQRYLKEILKDFLKIKYAATCSSGTAAGVMCLRALGVKAGDEVLVPSFTFIAAMESILEVGAVPVIVDGDKTFNMCPNRS